MLKRWERSVSGSVSCLWFILLWQRFLYHMVNLSVSRSCSHISLLVGWCTGRIFNMGGLNLVVDSGKRQIQGTIGLLQRYVGVRIFPVRQASVK